MDSLLPLIITCLLWSLPPLQQESETKSSLGWHYYDRGEYEAARKKFKEALRKNSDDTKARAGLGWCLFQAGKLSEAQKEFQKILKNDPTNSSALQGHAAVAKKRWATFTLATSLSSQGYFEQSILLFDQIIRKRVKDFPSDQIWRARLGKAWALYYTGDYSEAKEQFENVLKEKENEPTALQGLGYSYYQKESYPEARAELEKALRISPGWFAVIDNLGWCELKMQNYGRALAYFKEAIRLSPSTVDAHVGAAWVRQKGNRVEESLAHFRNAIALDPRYVENDDFRKLLTKNRAYRELLLPLGESYLSRGEYQTAISRLRRALYMEDTLRVRTNLAYACLQTKAYSEVISTLQNLSKTPSTKENALWRNASWSLGWAWYYEKNYEKALTIFERIEAMPEIGWCLLQQGKREEAEKTFQSVLKTFPTNELATRGMNSVHTRKRASIDKGWAAYYRKEYREARSSFEKALTETLPTNLVWEVRLGLGWCHIKENQFKEAETDLDEARYEALNAVDPITARATVQIAVGWSLRGSGSLRSAIDTFTNAAETLPEHIDIYRGLGWTYIELKQEQKAWDAFQKGLKISPRDTSCLEGIALLQPKPMDK